ncbi:unnamed protein product [Pieris macdunnoughi]|uniref:Uncharacterized protein n=1 Tax=Pieris macdunnoughi TaxID=345717 RepID=A0A821VSR7_9NEOP|nr:unnamed protein product [Pieris macdunnoughi]
MSRQIDNTKGQSGNMSLILIDNFWREGKQKRSAFSPQRACNLCLVWWPPAVAVPDYDYPENILMMFMDELEFADRRKPAYYFSAIFDHLIPAYA